MQRGDGGGGGREAGRERGMVETGRMDYKYFLSASVPLLGLTYNGLYYHPLRRHLRFLISARFNFCYPSLSFSPPENIVGTR